MAESKKERKALLEQAAKSETAHAQAFIPLVANVLKQCQQPMLEPPYCVAKGIGSHNLLSITAADIQRFTLPVDQHEPTKRPVTVCYGFEGVLTIAVLETLDGEQVSLQVFDGVPDDKSKYARWLIGKPVVTGAYYRLGDWTSPNVVLITEGIADAISCYEATGYPALAAISKSQLRKAAKAVKAKYPHAMIVICGDNDADGGGQRAAHEAAQAVGGYVVIPESVKDVNDLHRVRGLEAIKKMIDECLNNIREKEDFCVSEGEKQPKNDSHIYLSTHGANSEVHHVHEVHIGCRESDGILTKHVGGDAALSKVREALNTGDVGAIFEDATIEALKTLYNTSKSNWARVRVEIKKNRSIKLSDLEALIKPEREGEQSTTEQLLDIAKEQCEFFHDKDGETYASFIKGNHRECHRLQSKSFKEWLANELYKAEDTAPADNIINATINALNGQAKFDGDEKPVYMRVAKHDGEYWLDLCNDEWQAVKITRTGWQVINTPDVLFTRGDNMRALPTPTEGGDINLLWPLVNIPKHDHLKIIAWLIECLRPDTPYPVLEMTGEQGSVKSTSQKHLRKLIDPNKSNLRAAPKTIEDIWVTAKHGHIVSFENISHLSAGYQDALCVLATGGAYATRTLHTTSDETVIELKKPVMLNGIPVNVTAQDLLDRTLHIDLPVIESRITESEIEALFDKNYPSVFSGLLDIFVKVLGVLPTINDIERHELPRMADFALLGEAVYRLHGHPSKTFLNEYHEKRTEGIYRTLESSPVAVAAMGYLEDNPQGYDGTVKGLLETLAAFTPQGESWPRSAKGFADILRRLAPAFRTIGINAKISEKAGMYGYGCVLKRFPKKTPKIIQKHEHDELHEHGYPQTFAGHIYNSAQNSTFGEQIGLSPTPPIFPLSCTRILNEGRHDAAISLNDKSCDEFDEGVIE